MSVHVGAVRAGSYSGRGGRAAPARTPARPPRHACTNCDDDDDDDDFVLRVLIDGARLSEFSGGLARASIRC